MDETTAGARRPSRYREVTEDRTIRLLAAGIFVVVTAIVTVLLYAVADGLFVRPAPRTFAEQQLDMLATVVEEHPTSETAWAEYARVLIIAKQYRRAQTVLERADTVLGARVAETGVEWARLSLAYEDTAEAITRLDAAIAFALDYRDKEMRRLAEAGVVTDPRTVKREILERAYLMKARVLGSQQDWEGAKAALDGALYEQPTSADSLAMRGEALLELGRTEAAVADFERALSFVAEHPASLAGLERARGGGP